MMTTIWDAPRTRLIEFVERNCLKRRREKERKTRWSSIWKNDKERFLIIDLLFLVKLICPSFRSLSKWRSLTRIHHWMSQEMLFFYWRWINNERSVLLFHKLRKRSIFSFLFSSISNWIRRHSFVWLNDDGHCISKENVFDSPLFFASSSSSSSFCHCQSTGITDIKTA